METKDWIYSIGLFLTFGVSIISLIITIKNRRNAIREHLYKEQIDYFKKLSKEFSILTNCFDDVRLEKKLSDENDSIIVKQLDEIYSMSFIYDFITPDEILSSISRVDKAANDLHFQIMKNNGTFSKEDSALFYKSYFDLLEDIREFLGVDKLSDENKMLIGKNSK